MLSLFRASTAATIALFHHCFILSFKWQTSHCVQPWQQTGYWLGDLERLSHPIKHQRRATAEVPDRLSINAKIVSSNERLELSIVRTKESFQGRTCGIGDRPDLVRDFDRQCLALQRHRGQTQKVEDPLILAIGIEGQVVRSYQQNVRLSSRAKKGLDPMP
jgi:hypothetical protein